MNPTDSLKSKTRQAIEHINISDNERAQLAHARQRALSTPKPSLLQHIRPTVMVYASLFLTIGIITFSMLGTAPDSLPITQSLNDEFMLISSQDAIEMYQNLDFYIWLDNAMPAQHKS